MARIRIRALSKGLHGRSLAPRCRCKPITRAVAGVILSALALCGTTGAAARPAHASTTYPPQLLSVGCPSPAGSPDGVSVWIHVTHWCALPAVRRQIQVKLQMAVINTGKHPLEIGSTHFGLVLTQFNPKRWSPPKDGPPPPQRPFQSSYQGHRYWVVPANAPGAYDPVPGVPGDLTFATHFNPRVLQPGQYFRPSYHNGDVVFYVPTPGRSIPQTVIGAAFLEGDNIEVICAKWSGHTSADNF
jgi:hypothetical protein